MKYIKFLVLSLIYFWFNLSCSEKIEDIENEKVYDISITITELKVISTSLAECFIETYSEEYFELTDFGVCINTTGKPTIEKDIVYSLGGPYSSSYGTYIHLKDLIDNTKYYLRTYIRVNDYIQYGDELSFTTFKKDGVKPKP